MRQVERQQRQRGPSGTLTFGSNQSDAVPKQAYADMRRRASTAPNVKVTINTVDHNTFQENINTYLQGNPDDVFTWFAGYRMRFFAAQGLAGDISDVWANVTGMHRRAQDGVHRRRRQAVLRAALPTTRGRSSTARACSQDEGLPGPEDPGRAGHACPSRCRRTASSRSRSPTRTAGPRWARSTSSTCGSTATSSTST